MSEAINNVTNPEIEKATYVEVSNLKLKNNGWYVAELDIEVFRHGLVHLDGSGKNICIGQSEEIDAGSFGVEEGEYFTVHLDVCGGKDHVGGTWFIYNKNSRKTAYFESGGTTLNNSLEFKEYIDR